MSNYLDVINSYYTFTLPKAMKPVEKQKDMNRENIQQIIIELFRENFRLYPESYPLTEAGLMMRRRHHTRAGSR